MYVFYFLLTLFVSGFQYVITVSTYGYGYQYLVEEMTLLTAVAAPPSSNQSAVVNKLIMQPLDHFDAKETRTWSMRYLERLDFWKPDGPIYLFMCGEGTMHPVFLKTGILYELAKETNGAMFSSEHRYYGESWPLKVTTTSDLKYLSARQALADAASLLRMIKSQPNFSYSKVVVVGGSYAGNLAAWMKLLYPDLVTAAIASSAPVLAKVDFYEYIETVSDDYEQNGSPDCMDEIEKLFIHYETLFKSSSGIEQLIKEENICKDIDMTKPENKQLFFADKIGSFMGRAQYGNPDTIKRHCEKIMQGKKTTDFRTEIGLKFWRQQQNCYSYDFEEMIEEIKEIDWLLSWIYQTCTEFGYYQSTSSKNHPFTDNVPVDFYYKMCVMTFGPEYNETKIIESVEKSNKLYKGLALNVTNVVFPNGDMDPWMRLGIIEDISYNAPALMIPRSSHCRDLFSNRENDPEELKEARSYIKYLIKSWIGVGDYKRKKPIYYKGLKN